MNRPKWYEKYLPFVARSPEKQMEWLAGVLGDSLDKPGAGRTLSLAEIQPYVRLLLEDDLEERRQTMASLLDRLDERIIGQMLRAADIYDSITLFNILNRPTVAQVMVTLGKVPPPHDKAPHLLIDRLFLAVYRQTPALMEEAVRLMRRRGGTPVHFEPAYERFKEMVMDEELLSSLFPKVKV